MPDLADLFPGYESKWISTSSGRIFARVGGNGPPLMLLHGFSSTHVMWHKVAPQLADKFTLIIADLPGYGWSDMPESDKDHMPYSKRAMAQTMAEAMEQLSHATNVTGSPVDSGHFLPEENPDVTASFLRQGRGSNDALATIAAP